MLPPAAVAALTEARDAGVAAADEIATDYCGPDRAALGRTYLRDNIQYTLGAGEEAGLKQYYEFAETHGLIERSRPLTFYANS
jgi:hypothetical protein